MSNEPIEATTWEQCAQHVEAGGVVEVLGATGVWRASRYGAPFYRRSAAAPGTGGWFRRRLLPLPAIEVPAGHELVVLPCDVVDDWASDGVPGSRRAVILLDACRAAVARRPKPETEWVPWWEAVGRIAPDGRRINEVRHHRRGEPTVVTSAPSPAEFPPVGPDGMVEVLIEDRS